MRSTDEAGMRHPAVELWLDPVCPFSWNTARWLAEVAKDNGFEIQWHLMSLAVLNEGQAAMPPAQQTRMRDSRLIGRLMAAIDSELGQTGWVAAYFGFGAAYFDHGVAVDEHLAAQVLKIAGAQVVTVSSMWDDSLDATVRRSHDAAQQALGMTGGSPMLTIGGKTFFGPVLSSLPDLQTHQALFDAVVVLANTPQFSQVERPRASQGPH